MMTTIDDDHNGFRHVLIKLALSDKSASSEAVLQGILAFSAYHLSESGTGLEYSFAATKSLSASMRISTEPRDRLCQIAASMVLVTYGVRSASHLLLIFPSRERRLARNIPFRHHHHDHCDATTFADQ